MKGGVTMASNDELARRFHLDPALVRQSQERASDPLGAKALDMVGRMARFGVHITYEKARAIIEQEAGGESGQQHDKQAD